MRFRVLGWLLGASVSFCAAQSDTTFQLILAGGAGYPDGKVAIADLFKQLPKSGVPSAVIYLGDNLIPKGLGYPGDKDRKADEQSLLQQVAAAEGFGDIYFIAGNRDWRNGKHEGLEYRNNQQRFLDSIKHRNVHLFPRDGCPGPEEIHLPGDIVLVILDTQWFLHPWNKPAGEKSYCDSKGPEDVVIHTDDILNRNQGKRVIIVGHHPVVSYGPHGGEFTWKDHLFPLTQASPNLYIPLPIVGSLVPYYRKIFGNIQDTSHPLYKDLRRGLMNIMAQYPGTIYASGHERSLQYIEEDSTYFIVSGAASSPTFVRQKEFSKFASSEAGLVRLLIMSDGSAEAEYYTMGGKVFTAVMPPVRKVELEKPVVEIKASAMVSVRASYQYEASSFKKFILGENYRSEWDEKIPLQAFDIGREKGGLKIIQKGGGMETMSLRFRDSLGHEYTLRTVEKYPVRALPAHFQKTFLESVVQDQVSAEHPYGALVVAPLASTAGIFHANPKLVYAPNDPRWGIYRKEFQGQTMLFEERVDGPGKDMPSFGSPVRMISTRRLLEHMARDNDVHVDQELVLKSRLFDMWIGDWDRHDDQWRWGEFDSKKTRLYRPIPRDRDQAFFVNEGLIPSRWRKRHIFPKLEGFDKSIRWPPGLMQEGRWFDKTFLNAMPREKWTQAAKELTDRLTDAAIDSAVDKLPPEIHKYHGSEIAAKLKSRRTTLIHNAQYYYDFLSKEVDVTGSNKRERFELVWLPGGNLDVKVYKIDKDGHRGRLLFERELVAGQTKELRLYGLGGDDEFHFSGVFSGSPLVRVIGGDGMDALDNQSSSSARILVYDLKDGVKLSGNKVHNRTSSDASVNEYDRTSFEYNKVAPKNSISYNVDDGVFIGTGFSSIAHGFRKTPYQSHHLLTGAYAIRTGSFNIRYEGRFPMVVGKWALELDADVKSPYINNFFGWGNESTFDQNIDQQPGVSVANPIDYYRLRFRDFHGEIKLSRKVGQWGYVKAGPIYQRGQIVSPPGDAYIKDYSATLPKTILEVPQDFLGLTYTWGIDKRDNSAFATRGINLRQTTRLMGGLDGAGFTASTASFTLYQSVRLPARVTFVFNSGIGHNTGKYQVYQAQALDGKTEIRGFRKTRFYGDTKVYFNNEVRIKLATLHTYLFPAEIGLHGFYDVGRVWYSDPNGIDPTAPSGVSNIWHHGWGGGVWFTPFRLTTIVGEVGQSVEGTLFYLRLGFLY